MTTKLDSICEVVSEVEFSDDAARKVIALIKEFRAMPNRITSPAFRKLLDAVDEAAHFSTREQME